MADLDVVAVITAKAGSEAVVRQALEELVAPTRDEEGCISYDLKSVAGQPTVFVTVEKWRSQDDLDQHMQSPHIARTFEVAGEHLAGGPGIYPLADL